MPPNAFESELCTIERDLIASVLAASSGFREATEIVGPEDFADKDLGVIFGAVVDACESHGSALGEKAILSELKRRGLLRRLGDSFAVAELLRSGRLASQSCVYFALKVATASRSRRARSVAANLQRHIDSGGDWDVIAGQYVASLQAINSGVNAATPLSGPELQKRTIDSLKSKKQQVCPSGLVRFDDMFGGFPIGGVTVMAARTSVGKSAVSGDLAARAAEAGCGALFVSLEMSELELGYRFLARESNVDLKLFRQKAIDAEIEKLEATALSENLHVWVQPRVTIEQIDATVRRLAATTPLDLVVIDYLGLMGGPAESAYDRVTRNSQLAKQLAIQNNVAVIMCSQLNREAEKAEANLAHLALSGSVEQDADMIIFLNRDKVAEPRKMQLAVMKNRNGPLGYLDFDFYGEFSRLGEFDSSTDYVGEVDSNGDFSGWSG
jgi:replicative DNA helicase